VRDTDEIQVLHREIVALRWLCLAALLIPWILAAADFGELSAFSGNFDTITGKQIAVQSGEVYRIDLRMFGGQPTIILRDEQRRVRMSLGLAEFDPRGDLRQQHLRIMDAHRRKQGELLPASPAIRIFDEHGNLMNAYPPAQVDQ
jgi:hypothetical protein